MQRAHRVIELLQERDGFQILSSTKPIAKPLPGFPSVVEIQHRRDGIDAQSVQMKLFDPEERVRQQKIAHLVTRIVENVRTPFGVIAQSRIVVLVAGRAIESPQRPIVLGEVRGNPVQQDANSRLVQRVDEKSEVVWRSMARRGRKVPAYLIPPRPTEGMLEHRQQFHMREAKVRHVLGQ